MVGLRLPVLLVRSTVAQTTQLPKITDAGVWAPHVSFRQRRDGSVYIARGGQSDYDVTLDTFRYLREFMPNYLKNRRLFRMRIGSELWNDIARMIPGSGARRDLFAATVGVEPRPNVASARRSLSELGKLVPIAREARIKRMWAGLIDSTPDALPVIGPVDEPQGFVFATGFSGHGFAMGPIVGKLLSELIVDGAPSIALDNFSYKRFEDGTIGEARRAV